MKDFIKRNRILSRLGLVAALISISYAVTFRMPDYFGIEGWYSLLNNISISYIAALIFYALQVYMPENESRKRALMIMEPLFLDLVKFMEITIACCKRYVNIDDKGKLKINWWNKEKKILYFVPKSDSDNGDNQSAIKKSEVDLRALGTIYKSKIKEIKDRINFRDCDVQIINVLSKLEASDFYESTIIPALMFDGSFIGFPGFQESVNKFEVLKDEFKRSCGILNNYNVKDAENKDIALYETIFCQNGLNASTINELNETVRKEYIRAQLKAEISDEKQVDELLEIILQMIQA